LTVYVAVIHVKRTHFYLVIICIRTFKWICKYLIYMFINNITCTLHQYIATLLIHCWCVFWGKNHILTVGNKHVQYLP